ncbi:MAG: hypothetical protein PHX08_22125 [Lachnospiraceae bacterium]|nr:hypothetical protein [Lachnospiraceae bacterium]
MKTNNTKEQGSVKILNDKGTENISNCESMKQTFIEQMYPDIREKMISGSPKICG